MSDVEPEICNCAALRQATRRVTRLYDDALAPAGLGVNQFSILGRLSLVGPSTIQDLARLLVMDRSTLGHLLRPLEKRGFVKLEVSEQDRRSRMVALTQAGEAAVAKARPRWAAAQRRFESTFGKEAALEFRTVLKEIATAEYSWAIATRCGFRQPAQERSAGAFAAPCSASAGNKPRPPEERSR
jgi:DNA-binding MarR family transcriptional regulator